MRGAIPVSLGALLLSFTVVPNAFAQASDVDLREEIEALKKGQQEIQKQLQEIKRLVQAKPVARAPAGPDVAGKVFNIGDNPVKGLPAAKLTLIEFLDYQ